MAGNTPIENLYFDCATACRNSLGTSSTLDWLDMCRLVYNQSENNLSRETTEEYVIKNHPNHKSIAGIKSDSSITRKRFTKLALENTLGELCYAIRWRDLTTESYQLNQLKNKIDPSGERGTLYINIPVSRGDTTQEAFKCVPESRTWGDLQQGRFTFSNLFPTTINGYICSTSTSFIGGTIYSRIRDVDRTEFVTTSNRMELDDTSRYVVKKHININVKSSSTETYEIQLFDGTSSMFWGEFVNDIGHARFKTQDMEDGAYVFYDKNNNGSSFVPLFYNGSRVPASEYIIPDATYELEELYRITFNIDDNSFSFETIYPNCTWKQAITYSSGLNGITEGSGGYMYYYNKPIYYNNQQVLSSYTIVNNRTYTVETSSSDESTIIIEHANMDYTEIVPVDVTTWGDALEREYFATLQLTIDGSGYVVKYGISTSDVKYLYTSTLTAGEGDRVRFDHNPHAQSRYYLR